MKRFIPIFLLFLCLSGISFAQNKEGSGSLCKQELSHKGIKYTYYLYRPADLKPGAPLVVVFHGYGANKFPATLFGFNPIADKYGFAVCYPCGPQDFKGEHCWDVGYSFHKENNWKRDDVGFTIKLVKHLQKEYSLSKENIFATGHSNGGEMCYLLAYKVPDKFAAVAPVSGLTMKWMYTTLKPSSPIPLFEIHGTDDVVSKWNGDPYNSDGWGEYLSVPCALSYWVATNRCTYAAIEELPQKRNKVIAHKYPAGINNNQVWLYEIIGGTHAWPDKDLDAAEEIWKFFSLYLK
ncbi:MAG: prolyl oligopeptidase family serine peptidase [Bacteroidales bacterium]|nr:prolyl oligopeptidase family serine peptidase [Bacteroidales bacterium]